MWTSRWLQTVFRSIQLNIHCLISIITLLTSSHRRMRLALLLPRSDHCDDAHGGRSGSREQS